MKTSRFWFAYILMVIAQMVICNFCPASPYMMISILATMVLLIPIRYNTRIALVVAFITGLAVDFLADGLPGLNAFALVPVALLRQGILSLIFGKEIFARKENVSIAKNGIGKVSFAIILSQALFLTLYVWADLAGTRTFLFCLTRILVSLIASYPVALLAASCLTKEDRGQWR